MKRILWNKIVVMPLTLAIVAFSFSMTAAAAPSYDAGKALQEAKPPQPPIKKEQEQPLIPEVKEEEPFNLPEGETIYVSEFKLEGMLAEDATKLQELLTPYTQRKLSLTEIYTAADKVTSYYRSKGYMVAKTYVPKQDATSGIMTFKVLLGHYGKINISNSSACRDSRIQGIFEQAMPAGQSIVRQDLERAMLLTSELAGVSMPKVSISAGEQPGTTDFYIESKTTKRLEGYLLADNYGSRYTGQQRLNGALSINEISGLGDQLTISGQTTKAKGLQNGLLNYRVPLSSSGLRIDLGAGLTTYELGNIYRDLDATGTAKTIQATATYPLRKTSTETVEISASFVHKRMRDEMLDETISRKRSYSGILGLSRQKYGSLFGLKTASTLGGSLTYGHLKFPDSDEQDINEAGADTVGNFHKINLSFDGQMLLTKKLTLLTSIDFQKSFANKNLDGSEQLSLSGSTGVRCYRPGVLGDSGYIFNTELKYVLPKLFRVNNSIGLFTDIGRIYIEDNDYTTDPGGLRLSDLGLGYYVNYEYAKGRYLVSTIQAVWAYGPHEDTGSKESRSRVLAQVGITF